MKKLLLFLMFFLSIPAWAAPPSGLLLDACLYGEAESDVELTEIPFTVQIEEENYLKGYTARYTVFNNSEIGFAKKGNMTKGKEGIIYNKYLYPISRAIPINVTALDYQNLRRNGDLDLNQPAIWYLVTDKNKKQYICVSFSRSMEKAPPFIYVLPISTKPKQLFFFIGKSRK